MAMTSQLQPSAITQGASEAVLADRQPAHAEGKAVLIQGGPEQHYGPSVRPLEDQLPPLPQLPVPAHKPRDPLAFDFILNADMEEVDEVSSSTSSDDEDF